MSIDWYGKVCLRLFLANIVIKISCNKNKDPMKRKCIYTLFIVTATIMAFTHCTVSSSKSNKVVVTSSNDEFLTIDFPELLKKKKNAFLSEISDSIAYVHIETSDHSLLDYVIDAKLTDDFMFIKPQRGLLRQFDRKGNFIRNIGKKGRGPGEYTYCMTFSLDKKERLIYIQDYIKILIYNFDGVFQKSVTCPQNSPCSIVHHYDDQFIQFSDQFMGNEKFAFTEWNSKGDSLQEIPNYTFWKTKNPGIYFKTYHRRNVFYKLNNSLHLKGWYNDTIYTFDENRRFKPKYFIDLKKYKLPDEARIEVSLKGPRPKDCYWLGVKESNRYIFIYFNPYYEDSIGGGPDYILWNKEAHDGYLVNEKNGKSVFINDLDNGPDFIPTFINDSIAYCFINPIDLKEQIKTYTSTNKKEQILDSKLLSLGASMKNEDNPLLMIVYLKR